jgi:hypothetical protein
MTCAIDHKSMAHQWRKQFAPMMKVALRKKLWRNWRANALFLMAQLWRNGALVASENTPASSLTGLWPKSRRPV